MDYVSRNYSKYLLMAHLIFTIKHLIFVCKYRKNLLVRNGDEIGQMDILLVA